jgi:predicted short-subunit dehydrogenase-like oxidoreductase (DUF2520 family)
VAIIGAGRVGTAFGVLLERAKHRVMAASGGDGSRDRARRHLMFARFLSLEDADEAARSARIVLLGVPDDAIGSVCGDLAARDAFSEGQAVVHFSGSLGLDVLQPAEAKGVMALSLHPLQSVPDVEAGIERIPGSAIAVTARNEEGLSLGERLARDAGGTPFRLSEEVKPLYHAAAVFASNYVVAVEAMAARLFGLAGLERPVGKFGPLARSALDAALERGPEAALTGPASRGDVGTVSRNLGALSERAPEAVEPYVVLARMAGRLARQGGRLTQEQLSDLELELDRWT